MERPNRWKTIQRDDGVWVIEFSSWKYFPTYVFGKFTSTQDYIFRGQRSQNWALEPTLDRNLRKRWELEDRTIREDHFERFQFATRGRLPDSPGYGDEENEWWALGQHHGLATPLLDWTRSPFVAAYFAFIGDGCDNTEQRMVYALSTGAIEQKSGSIRLNHSGHGRPPIVELVQPLSNENPRLVNQDGLFTRCPDYQDLESWVMHYFKGSKKGVLIKMAIPNSEREGCLKALNQMNINHLTLFPDLYGASKYCNLALDLKGY